jgi:hypothetical protein
MTDAPSGFLDRQDLGVPQRIVVPLAPIETLADHFTLAGDHRTDRNLAQLSCCLGFLERETHEQPIGIVLD